MRKNDTAIALTEEQKQLLMEQIHDFFDAEFDEDIGIIKQSRILDNRNRAIRLLGVGSLSADINIE